METPYQLKYYTALIDFATGAVLTVGTNVAPMVFLKECMPDTWVANNVNSPNYLARFFPMPFFLSDIDPRDYPKWTWDGNNRLFLKTKKELIDERLLERSRLADEKQKSILNIMRALSTMRQGISTGVSFQEYVYAKKALQAEQFKQSGYNEDSAMEFPYVLQYADFAGISLQQAADDILLKRAFDDELLLKTELIRLAYFKRIRDVQTVEELPALHEDFMKDAYRNALI